jgi:hypothetical protein
MPSYDRQPCAKHPDRLSIRADVAACAVCWRSLCKKAQGLPGQERVSLTALDLEEAVISRAIRPSAAAAIATRRRP